MQLDLVKRKSTIVLGAVSSQSSIQEFEDKIVLADDFLSIALTDSYQRYGEIVYTANKILPSINFGMGNDAVLDFERCLKQAIVFLDVTYTTLKDFLQTILEALRHENITRTAMLQKEPTGYQPALDAIQILKDRGRPTQSQCENRQAILESDAEFTVDLAMENIFCSENGGPNLANTMQRSILYAGDSLHYDHSWLIILCELPSIKSRKIAIIRLNRKSDIMPSCRKAKCVVLIVTNSMQKGNKSMLETGLKFATVMSFPFFMSRFEMAPNERSIIDIYQEALNGTQNRYLLFPNFLQDVLQAVAIGSYKKKFCPPLYGMIEDFRRRKKYYLSDFADGVVGFKIVQKLVTAILFQYMTTILTIVQLGHITDTITKGHLTTKTLLYSQFYGSILYAIFSGQPMMMFQVSPVILLYAKVIFAFSEQQDFDYASVLAMTGIFSGILLILVGIFNLANIMVYATSSIAESIDIFQSLTFCVTAVRDLHEVYTVDYECEFKLPDCHPEGFVLNLFIVTITISLGYFLQSIRSSAIFNMTVREILSDMSFCIAVFVSAFTASFLFSGVKLHPLCYDEKESVHRIPRISNIQTHVMVNSFLLAIPLMLIIFLDHNLNSEFLLDPRNKLHKGCAVHFDMFVVGSINCFLGCLGMPSLQGMYPQTPLHIKQMADIETKVEGGVKEERIIRVRDTRITQLAVGMLVGVSAFLLPLPINYIPRAALDGLLLCIALISLKGNITIDRLKLLIKSQSAFPVNHQIRRIPVKEVHKFTLLQMIQLIIACCLGFIENTVMNILFPVMIFMMLPIRQLIIPRFFIPEHLELLDPNKVVYEDGNSPDDFIDADISSPGSYKEPGKNIVPQTGHTDVKNEGSSFSFKTSDTTDSYGSRALKFFSFKGSPV